LQVILLSVFGSGKNVVSLSHHKDVLLDWLFENANEALALADKDLQIKIHTRAFGQLLFSYSDMQQQLRSLAGQIENAATIERFPLTLTNGVPSGVASYKCIVELSPLKLRRIGFGIGKRSDQPKIAGYLLRIEPPEINLTNATIANAATAAPGAGDTDSAPQGLSFREAAISDLVSALESDPGFSSSMPDTDRTSQIPRDMPSKKASFQGPGILQLMTTMDQIFNSIPEAIIIADPSGKILLCNLAMKVMLNLPAEANLDYVSQLPQYLEFKSAANNDLPLSEWPFLRALRGEALLNYELLVKTKTLTRPCEVKLAGIPFFSRTGQLLCALVCMYSNTASKYVQKTLERLLYEYRNKIHFFEKLIFEAPVGMAVIGGENHIVEVANPIFLKMLHGCKSLNAPVEGRKLEDLLTKEQYEAFAPAIKEAYQLETQVDINEYKIPVSSKAAFSYWNLSFVPMRNYDDSLTKLIIIARNVTNRLLNIQRSEVFASIVAELNARREYTPIMQTVLSLAVESLGASDGSIYLYEPDQRHLRVVSELLPKGRIGQVISIDDHPHEKEALYSLRPIYYMDSEAAPAEADLLKKLKMKAAFAVPLINSGQAIGLISLNFAKALQPPCADTISFMKLIAAQCTFAIDRAIAYQKNAQLLESERQARIENEEKNTQLNVLLQTMEEGVIIFDANANILLQNSKVFHIIKEYGGTIAEAENFGSQLLYPDKTVVPFEQYPHRRLLRGEAFHSQEYLLVKDNLDPEHYWVSGSTVKDPSGKVQMAMLILNDITAIRKMEQSRENYLYAISHDLRTPLSVISAWAQFTERSVKRPERVKESMSKINSAVWKMNYLIQDIVDSARIESGQLQLIPSRTSLLSFMATMIEEFRGAIETSRIRLSIPEDLCIMADTKRLSRIMINLLNNALKYSPDHTIVTVEAYCQDDQAVISVIDHGTGIEPSEIGKLFQRYYRTESGRKNPNSVGLGLYITKELVQAHGGRIWVESTPGVGSKFSFTMPLAASGDQSC
jgi:signal transduction histidine kinase